MVRLEYFARRGTEHAAALQRATSDDVAEQPGIVVTGPPRSGKSSLAFQCAVSAAEAGRVAAYVCNPSLLPAKMPKPPTPLDALQADDDADCDVLQRIEFRYMESLRDARGYCAAGIANTRAAGAGSREASASGSVAGSGEGPVDAAALPSVIVLDDDSVPDAGDRLSSVKTLATLANTVEWIRDARRAAGLDTSDVFFVYVVAQAHAAGVVPGSAPAAFPLTRVGVHLVTRATTTSSGVAALPDGSMLFAGLVHSTNALEDSCGCVATLSYALGPASSAVDITAIAVS